MNIHENCDFHAFSCYYIEDQENKMSINFAFSSSDAFQLRAYYASLLYAWCKNLFRPTTFFITKLKVCYSWSGRV